MENLSKLENISHTGAGVPIYRARTDRDQWLRVAEMEQADGAVLLSLWGDDRRQLDGAFRVCAALLGHQRLLILELPVAVDMPTFPSLTSLFPCAQRLERAVYDLLGLRAEGGDTRPWLRHTAWPDTQFPLRHDFQPAPVSEPAPEDYPFVTVEGDGVHEIPVGPVHAGIIEPGHFRFSVVGEKVLRLEERLGYVHKGIEKLFETFSLNDGQRLAARISGDSAVAYSWAYCMALEGLCGTAPPARALWLRALYLERERLANHLGDLGALGNDAGLALGLAQFLRLKEDLLGLNAGAFGARYLMDAVVPGGVAADLAEEPRRALQAQCAILEREVSALRVIYDEHAGLHDRFADCGQVLPGLAQHLGLIGLAGRASGQARDLRCDFPAAPYAQLGVKKMTRGQGDVLARVAVRFDEVFESLRLCREILQHLPTGAVRVALSPAGTGRLGVGLIEGWRGPVLVALEAKAGDAIHRCHAHDPSWQNWPVLEHAVVGNIVPDFPLINKSFNLSYSGQDL